MTLELAMERIAELEKQMSMVMEKMEIAVDVSDAKPKKEAKKPSKKAKKEEAAAEEKPKKKRGMTGYLLFAKEKRPDVKAELVEGGNESPKPTEVITEVAKQWKGLSDEQREEWNERAKATNEDSE